MEVELQTLNNEGIGKVTITPENDKNFVVLRFSDNPEHEYSVDLLHLYRAMKVFKNLRNIKK